MRREEGALESRTEGTAPAAPTATPESARAATVGIVILTQDAREDTLACIARLLPQLHPGDRVCIADNGSSDGTEELVRRRFPEVEYVQNGHDLGMAGGRDPAMAKTLNARVTWLLLLDKDARPHDGFLESLRAAAHAAPADVAAIQPLVVDADAERRVLSAGYRVGRFPGVRVLRRRPRRRDAQGVEIFGTTATATLLRSRALREVGLLDPALFRVFEDVDLMFRLRCEGWKARLAPGITLPLRRTKAGRERRRNRFWRQRNLVVLALRWWPTAALVLDAPRLGWRMLEALWFALVGGGGPIACWPLWQRARGDRRENRRSMAARGADRWFGRGPEPVQTKAGDAPESAPPASPSSPL